MKIKLERCAPTVDEKVWEAHWIDKKKKNNKWSVGPEYAHVKWVFGVAVRGNNIWPKQVERATGEDVVILSQYTAKESKHGDEEGNG